MQVRTAQATLILILAVGGLFVDAFNADAAQFFAETSTVTHGELPPTVKFLANDGARNRTSTVVTQLRRGRNVWLRFQENGDGRFGPRIETNLGPGCQAQTPTARTRRPTNRRATVRSPQPFYCLAPRMTPTNTCPVPARYSLYVELGNGIDGFSSEALGATICSNISGGGGGDVIKAGAGPDTVCAGVNGTAPPTTTCSTAAADSQMSQIQDVIFGGAGDDQLQGDGGVNSLHGGLGTDHLVGGDGNDLLIGDQGDDTMQGGRGDDMFDTNWIEGTSGEQTSVWTVGRDIIDGDVGTDTVGYNHLTRGVTANAMSAVPSGGSRDEFRDIEVLMLSEGDDVFSGGPGFDFTVQGLRGHDQIDVAHDASRSHNQRVYCGPGEDQASIDVNVNPNDSGARYPPPAFEIREDSADQCERITYNPLTYW